jgi:inosine-uridine nucleoside N-ribohydrolase
MRSAPILCPEIHGESGLDGPDGGVLLPRSNRLPTQDKACHVMFQAISSWHQSKLLQEGAAESPQDPSGAPEGHAQSPYQLMNGGGHSTRSAEDGHGSTTAAYTSLTAAAERVRLVCTGALTNAAVLLTVYPEVAAMIEVVLMGGCLGVGNTGPVMEFNIQTDPEAAKIVFEAGVPLTMVPLEVCTHLAGAPSGVCCDCLLFHSTCVSGIEFRSRSNGPPLSVLLTVPSFGNVTPF